jgi:hypothetical protein
MMLQTSKESSLSSELVLSIEVGGSMMSGLMIIGKDSAIHLALLYSGANWEAGC